MIHTKKKILKNKAAGLRKGDIFNFVSHSYLT